MIRRNCASQIIPTIRYMYVIRSCTMIIHTATVNYVCSSYNMGMSPLPDMYARSPPEGHRPEG